MKKYNRLNEAGRSYRISYNPMLGTIVIGRKNKDDIELVLEDVKDIMLLSKKYKIASIKDLG